MADIQDNPEAIVTRILAVAAEQPDNDEDQVGA